MQSFKEMDLVPALREALELMNMKHRLRYKRSNSASARRGGFDGLCPDWYRKNGSILLAAAHAHER